VIKKIIFACILVTFLATNSFSSISTDFTADMSTQDESKKQTIYKGFTNSELILAKATIAILHSPNNTKARYFLVYLYTSLGRKNKAVEECIKIFKSNPDDALPLMMICFIYEDEDSKSSIEKLSTMLKDYPKNRSVRLAIAFSVDKLKDKETMIKKLVSKYPDSSVAHCVLGDIYFDSYKWNEAVLEYGKAVGIGFEDSDEYSHIGFNLKKMHRYEKALICYRKAIKLEPDNWGGHDGLGCVYRDSGRYKESVEEYKKAIQINPGKVSSYRKLARVYKILGLYDEAIVELKKALVIAPNQAKTHYRLALVHRKKKMFDKAIEETNLAIELDPNYAYAYRSLGYSYCKKKMFDEAISAVNRAIELDILNGAEEKGNANFAWSHNTLGFIYKKKKMYDEAISAINRAIELDILDGVEKKDNANFAWSHNTLGSMYNTKKMYKESISHYQKALKIKQKSGIYNGLGHAYMSMKNYEQAAVYCKKEIEFDKDRTKYTAYAKCSLGEISDNIRKDYFDKEDYDTTIKEQKKILKIYPDIPNACVLLGDCYEKKGEQEKAIVQYRKALEINPKFKPALERLKHQK